MKCLDIDKQLQWMDGQFPSQQQQAWLKHVDQCAQCAALRQDLTDIMEGLKCDPAEFDDFELAEDVLTLVRLGQADRPKWGKFQIWSQSFGLMQTMVATGLVLIAIFSFISIWQATRAERPDSSAEFIARSGSTSSLDSWVSVTLFRATQAGYVPAANELAAGDGIAFSYVMRPESGYGYLMILALDQAGQIYWYYPAFERTQNSHQSISVRSTQSAQSLPHEVKHDLRPGALRFFAIFSKEPLQVGDVERKVLADAEQAGSLINLQRLSISQTGQQSLLVQVKGN